MTTGDALFENGVYPVILCNTEKKKILKVNNVFKEWFLIENPEYPSIGLDEEDENQIGEVFLSVLHKNGNRIRCLASKQNITENGQKNSLLILHESMTTANEKIALRNRSANFYALSENIDYPFWSIDTSLRFLDFNKKFRDLIKNVYDVKVERGDHFSNRISGFMGVSWAERFDLAFRGEKQEYADELLGQVMTTTILPIFSKYKEVLGICCTIRNITSEINQQKNMEVIHHRFTSILNSSADAAIIATDPEGIIRQFNRGASQMLGYGRDEIIGKTGLRNFFTPSFLRNLNVRIEESTGSKIAVDKIFPWLSRHPEFIKDIEWFFINKQGSIISVKISISPVLMNDNSFAGVLMIAQDISELKRVREELEIAKLQAEETSRTKTSFLANMSHEIRTPLNGIIGMADLLNRSDLTSHQENQLSVIIKSANTLLLLINDILDYSRIEAGKFKLGLQTFSLRNVLSDIEDIFQVNIQERNLHFRISFDDSVTDNLYGDPRRIKQILLNLVGNAMKFTLEGSITIEVKSIRETAGWVRLYFRVADTGIGISEEEKHKLFQTFSQVDSSATRKYGGSGLGLAISKELVMMMDGEIGMDSAEGKGSVFWFTIKLKKDTEDIYDKKILIINPNRISRRTLCRSLKEMDIKTIEEMEKWDESHDFSKYDILFVDAKLDQKNKEFLLEQKSIGLIETSFGIESSIEGFHGTLQLPTDQRSLEKCIREVIQEKEEDNQTSGEMKATTDSAPVEESPIRVLIAEDNKINQLVTMNFMKKLDYEATLVENGQDAVDICKKEHFDIILMDQMMPVMDGITATGIIRKEKELMKNPNIIIIALTANAMKGDREILIEAGMDDYIPKPVLLKDIKAVIEKNLSK